MSLIKKIGIGTAVVASAGIVVCGFVYGLKSLFDEISYEEEREITKQILDKDRNGKVDYKENIPFFEITGKYFSDSSKDDVRKFLSPYRK